MFRSSHQRCSIVLQLRLSSVNIVHSGQSFTSERTSFPSRRSLNDWKNAPWEFREERRRTSFVLRCTVDISRIQRHSLRTVVPIKKNDQLFRQSAVVQLNRRKRWKFVRRSSFFVDYRRNIFAKWRTGERIIFTSIYLVGNFCNRKWSRYIKCYKIFITFAVFSSQLTKSTANITNIL